MTVQTHRMAIRPLVRDVLAIDGLEPALSPAAGLPHLRDVLQAGSVVAISGAGISTESGIPDYRGPSGRARKATPMHYDDFARSDAARRRYWARAYAGWGRMGLAEPNPGHRAVTALQRAGHIGGLITQNVDRLHVRAGSDPVIELHGSLDRVVCLTCRQVSDRQHVQERLQEANPGFDVALFDFGDDAGEVRPDGDLDLLDSMIEGFQVVACRACGDGPLKPDVVFFGESVAPQIVRTCSAWVESASAVLVLGSSLAVMSAYRFVRLAHRRGVPVVVVNDGPTRGDGEAAVRVAGSLGEILTTVCHELEIPVGPQSG